DLEADQTNVLFEAPAADAAEHASLVVDEQLGSGAPVSGALDSSDDRERGRSAAVAETENAIDDGPHLLPVLHDELPASAGNANADGRGVYLNTGTVKAARVISISGSARPGQNVAPPHRGR